MRHGVFCILLNDFLHAHHDEIIARAWRRVAERTAPVADRTDGPSAALGLPLLNCTRDRITPPEGHW